MPLDGYSVCPAGTGKKIKFCCPSNWQDLEKISRLVEGEQYRAALQQVDQLLAKQPERACLWTYKTVLERVNGNAQGAIAAANEFLTHCPRNPVALAEHAIALAIQDELSAALPEIEASLKASQENNVSLVRRQIEALLLLNNRLAGKGELPAAWYLLSLIEMFRPEMGSELIRRKTALAGFRGHPVALREPAPLPLEVPEDAPAEYRQVAEAIHTGQLTEARQLLRDWIQAQPDQALPWYLLGLCSLWQLDYVTAGESFLRYSELTPDEDTAVAAKVLSYHLKKDPWGDAEDLVNLIYTIPDPAGVKEAILSDRHLKVVSADATSYTEDGPPPELTGLVLRHEADIEEWPIPNDLANESVAIVSYFGRQTGREAQVHFTSVLESDVGYVEERLREWCGSGEWPAPVRVVSGRRSRLSMVLAYTVQAILPDQLPGALRKLLKEIWADRPNKALGDVSPREAAADTTKRRTLKAVLEWLREFDSPELSAALDELKVEWNLRDGPPRSSARMEGNIRVPISVVARVDSTTLSDDEIRDYFFNAVNLDASSALAILLDEVVARRERLHPAVVLEAYCRLIRNAEEGEAARKICETAIAFAEQHNMPHGRLHVELITSGLLESGQGRAEFEHLINRHMDEPSIEQWVLGVIQAAESRLEHQAEEVASKPQGLWTPDAAAEPTPAASEAKPKIWTPGQD